MSAYVFAKHYNTQYFVFILGRSQLLNVSATLNVTDRLKNEKREEKLDDTRAEEKKRERERVSKFIHKTREYNAQEEETKKARECLIKLLLPC